MRVYFDYGRNGKERYFTCWLIGSLAGLNQVTVSRSNYLEQCGLFNSEKKKYFFFLLCCPKYAYAVRRICYIPSIVYIRSTCSCHFSSAKKENIDTNPLYIYMYVDWRENSEAFLSRFVFFFLFCLCFVR